MLILESQGDISSLLSCCPPTPHGLVTGQAHRPQGPTPFQDKKRKLPALYFKLKFRLGFAIDNCMVWCVGVKSLTSALDLAVTLEARLTLADVLGRQVAALRVLHALSGQLWDLALVNI